MDFPGHSVPLTALGAFILILGFLSFNGGSQGSISEEGDADTVALAIVNTILGTEIYQICSNIALMDSCRRGCRRVVGLIPQ